MVCINDGFVIPLHFVEKKMMYLRAFKFLCLEVWMVTFIYSIHGPLARHVKLWVPHAPGIPGTFSTPSRVSDPDLHHGTYVTHVPRCMPGSLISDFLWSRRRGKRSRHSRRMRNPPFCVSGKRPIGTHLTMIFRPSFIEFFKCVNCYFLLGTSDATMIWTYRNKLHISHEPR